MYCSTHNVNHSAGLDHDCRLVEQPPRIEVATYHTVPISEAFDTVEEQIAHVQETWRKVFEGADDLTIKVQRVDVYSVEITPQ